MRRTTKHLVITNVKTNESVECEPFTGDLGKDVAIARFLHSEGPPEPSPYFTETNTHTLPEVAYLWRSCDLEFGYAMRYPQTKAKVPHERQIVQVRNKKTGRTFYYGSSLHHGHQDIDTEQQMFDSLIRHFAMTDRTVLPRSIAGEVKDMGMWNYSFSYYETDERITHDNITDTLEKLNRPSGKTYLGAQAYVKTHTQMMGSDASIKRRGLTSGNYR